MPQLQNTDKKQLQPQYNTGLEVIKGLLQLVGQGATGAAKSVGGQVMDNSPAALIGKLLGTISSIPDVQRTQQAIQGTQTQQKNPQFNPYQEGVIKALKKAGEAHASEAVMSGVTPEHVVEQAGVMPQTDSGAINVQQVGQKAPEQQVQQNFNIPKQGLLETNQNYGQTLLNILTKQKISGQEQLQYGEREKLNLTAANNVAVELEKHGNPDALTPEASAKFNLMIDGNKATQEVASLLQENPGVIWSAPSFLKSQKSRQYESSVKRMIRNKLRLESGATIGDKEVNEEYGKYRIGKTDSPETIRMKLRSLYEFYEGSLNVADPTGIHRQRAGGSRDVQTIGRFQVEAQ